MAQTTFNYNPGVGLPGLTFGVDNQPGLSRTAETVMEFGVAVTEGTDAGSECKPLAATGDRVIGFARRNLDQHTENSADQIMLDADVSIMYQGSMYVLVEDAVVAGADVFVRHTAPGVEKLGACRSDADGVNADLLPGARFLKGALAGQLAVIVLNLP